MVYTRSQVQVYTQGPMLTTARLPRTSRIWIWASEILRISSYFIVTLCSDFCTRWQVVCKNRDVEPWYWTGRGVMPDENAVNPAFVCVRCIQTSTYTRLPLTPAASIIPLYEGNVTGKISALSQLSASAQISAGGISHLKLISAGAVIRSFTVIRSDQVSADKFWHTISFVRCRRTFSL